MGEAKEITNSLVVDARGSKLLTPKSAIGHNNERVLSIFHLHNIFP
jgi:hypothetical protein